MESGLVQGLAVVAAVGNGIVAGSFFAFSTFVMKALGRTRPPVGLDAMQAINVAAPTPPFMLALFGSAAVGVAVSIAAMADWGGSGAGWALAGGVAGLVPAGLTMTYHVPRNNDLAGLDAGSGESVEPWRRYLREWTAANHLRTLGAAVAALAFTLAVRG